MDTHDRHAARCARRERHLAQMRSPSREAWPLYPLLPLDRPSRHLGQLPELAVLFDFRGQANLDGLQTRVLLSNAYDLLDDRPTIAELLAQPHLSYASFEAILDDGWAVC